MTLPRLAALTRRWSEIPPAAVQLSRIAAVLGIKPKASAAQVDPIAAARAAGVPIASELPNDPDLVFLDDTIPLGGSAHGR